MEQMEQLTSMCEMFGQFIQKKQEEKQIEEEQAAKAQNLKIPVCYDDDDDYNSAITPDATVDSLSMGSLSDEDFVEEIYSNPLFEEEINSMRIDQHHFNADKGVNQFLAPLPGRGIDDDILLTIKDDILSEKMLNINLLIANIEALNDNPTPSSDFMTK
nr:hypothetical protein [Tanacetum cinerariifolium]